MTPELRQTIVLARTESYNSIMRTTIFALIAVAAVLFLGPDRFSLPLLVITITVTAYGILAGGAALDDINNLKADMTPEFSDTAYGSAVADRDISQLKRVSSVLIGATGLGTLIAILF